MSKADRLSCISTMMRMAKAAFHYSLWASPGLRGNEPSLAPLRSFISGGVGNWPDFVELDAQQFLSPLRDRVVPNRMTHFFCSALTPAEAIGFVQFFVGPNDLPSPSRVRLAANPLVIHAQAFTCHQARYFGEDADPADGHDGELITLSV